MNTEQASVWRAGQLGRLALALVAGLLVMVVAGGARAELRVVATLPDLAALAREVGGEHASVDALAASTEDPHYVDARPSLIVKLNKADLLIVNGLELESGWLPPLQKQARNPAILTGGAGYLDASRAVKLKEVGAVVDRSQGDIHPGGNPHFTFDPRAAREITRAIMERMATLDPDHAAAYRKNGERLVADLDALVKGEEARFGKLSAARRRVVVYHRSLPYLLDWLKIEQVTTIEPKPGVAPSPGQVAAVLKTMREGGVGVILQEEYYPRKTADTLARMAKGRIVVLDGGTRVERGERYVDHIRRITEQIHDALAR